MFTSTYFDALCAVLRIDRFVCRSRLSAAIKEIMPADRLRLARDISMLRWETLSPDFLVSHATKDANVGMSKDCYIKRLRSQGEVEALIKECKSLDEQMMLLKKMTIERSLNALFLSHPEIPTSSKEPALFRTLPHFERQLATL